MIDQALVYYAQFQELASNSVFQEWGVLGLFINALLSATALPLPTEILTSSLLAGGESQLVVSLVLVAGSSVGGILNYWLGFGGGKLFGKIGAKFRKLFGMKEKITDDKHDKKSHNILNKFGWVAIFFAPFILVVGDIILMSAGTKKMDFKKYMFFMVAGKIFKTVVVVGLLGIVF